jgi:RNA polymerase sigma-70 factor (ECF subfamily)
VVSVSLNLRKQVRRIRDRHHGADTESLPAAAAGEADPALWSAVRREVDALPDRMRVILIMHDLEGYTHAEIADALRIAEATSRVHLTRARQRVRARLARVGITGVDHG